MKAIYKWIHTGIHCFIISILSFTSITCKSKTMTSDDLVSQDTFKLINYDPTMPIFGFHGPQDLVYGKPLSIHYRGSVESENGPKDEPLLTQDIFFNSQFQISSTLKYNNNGPAQLINFYYSNSGNPIVITTIYFNDFGNSMRTIQYFDNDGNKSSASDKWMGDEIIETRVEDKVDNTKCIFNAKGQILEVNESNIKQRWVYDEKGRLIARIQNNQTWINFIYKKESDKFGNWTQLEYEMNQTKYLIRRDIIYQK